MSRTIRWLALIALGVWLALCVVLGMVVYAYGRTDRAEPADVIIVLGSGLNRDMSPGPGLVRRGGRAAELYHEGYAPVLICSGGYAANWATRSEADACAQVLRDNGVPDEAIILEEQSRSTEENALHSHIIMQERGFDTALIVSDGYHLLRATWIFSAEGIAGTTSPAPQPSFFSLLNSTAREVVALHWQVVKTVLGLPVTFVPWI